MRVQVDVFSDMDEAAYCAQCSESAVAAKPKIDGSIRQCELNKTGNV